MRYTIYIISFLFILTYLSCDKNDISITQSESFIKFYRGPMFDNAGIDVKQNDDEGYAVLGTVSTPDNGADMCLIITDKYGNAEYEMKYYGGTSDDYAKQLKILDDGGLLLLGSSQDTLSGNLDIFLVRTNSSGDSLWSGHYGGEGNEEAYDIKIDNSGNFVLVGYTDTHNPLGLITIDRPDKLAQVLILKVDPDGNIITPVVRPFGKRDKDDIGHGLEILDDGYLVVGSTNSGISLGDDRFFTFIAKVDFTGYPYGDLYTLFETRLDYINRFSLLPDGNILVAGTATSSTSANTYLTKINFEDLSEKMWENIIYPSENTYNTDLIIEGNEIILAGTRIASGSVSNIMLIKTATDSLSTILSLNEYGLSAHMESGGFDLTDDNGFIFTGSNITTGNSVIALIKTRDDGSF